MKENLSIEKIEDLKNLEFLIASGEMFKVEIAQISSLEKALNPTNLHLNRIENSRKALFY